MSTAPQQPFTRTWPAGPVYTATLITRIPKPGEAMHCEIEWSPSMPERLSDEDFAEYRRGRNAAFAELAAMLGGRAAVLDVA